jgi:hypothetical protein
VLVAAVVDAVDRKAAISEIDLGKTRISKDGAFEPADGSPKNEECDPNKGPDKSSPVCDAVDCAGIEGRCTTGESTGCACTPLLKVFIQW